jgi:hypothetical protein
MDLCNGLADELPCGVTQMRGRISSAQQYSQRGLGDDDHGSTPLNSWMPFARSSFVIHATNIETAHRVGQ